MHHVFDLCGQPVIDGVDSPSVVFVYEKVRTAFVDHGFDRKHHSWNEKHFTALWRYVADKRIFVESKADAVPADFFYDRITVCLCVGVDRIRDISQVSPWLCGSQTKFNTLFCYADQPFCAVRDFSRSEARREGN